MQPTITTTDGVDTVVSPSHITAPSVFGKPLMYAAMISTLLASCAAPKHHTDSNSSPDTLHSSAATPHLVITDAEIREAIENMRRENPYFPLSAPSESVDNSDINQILSEPFIPQFTNEPHVTPMEQELHIIADGIQDLIIKGQTFSAYDVMKIMEEETQKKFPKRKIEIDVQLGPAISTSKGIAYAFFTMKIDEIEYRIPLVSTDVILSSPHGEKTPLDALTVARKIIADMRQKFFLYLNSKVMFLSEKFSRAEDYDIFLLELDKLMEEENIAFNKHGFNRGADVVGLLGPVGKKVEVSKGSINGRTIKIFVGDGLNNNTVLPFNFGRIHNITK